MDVRRKVTKEEDETREPRFFDVDRFRRVLALQSLALPPGRFGRSLRRARSVLDSVRGLFSALSVIPILFGAGSVVVLGVLYGPLAFLAAAGGMLGLLALYVDRSVGKSLQFGDYPLGLRVVAQIAAFILAVALFLLFVNFSGLMGF